MTTAVESQVPPAAEANEPKRAGAGRIILGFVLSLLSTVMLFVMWDGEGNLWPLVFIAFVPMYIAAYRVFPRRLSALPFGFAGFGYWLAMAFGGGGVLGVPVCIAIGLFMGIIWTVIGIFEPRFTYRTNYRWFLVQLPVLWVGLEIIGQSNLLLGSNYWIAYRLASVPEIIQPVSVFSSPALSFVLVMINAFIAMLMLKLMDAKWPQLAAVAIPRRVLIWTSVVSILVIVCWLALSLHIFADVGKQSGKSVRVAAVQTGNQYTAGELGPNSETAAQSAERNVKLAAQLTQMTKEAAGQGAELVVWPEWLLTYDATSTKGAWVGELAKATNTTIVLGYVLNAADSSTPNMAATYLPNGQLAGEPYFKVHTVIAEGESFTSTKVYPTYTTPVGQLGVAICFDHDFPNSTIRIETASGANIFAVPALDFESIENIRWQSVVFRSVENRVPLVKADMAWDSVITKANGQVQQRSAIASEKGGSALLVANVNQGPRNAPFTSWGGYAFGTVIVLGLAFRIVWQIVLWRRQRRSGSAS